MASTIPGLMERAIAALEVLARTAEPVADEEQYVRDLVTVWSARLRAVGAAHAADTPTEVACEELDDAFAWLTEEAGRIVDPHRAIDWLSTLPQVALVAVGEDAA
jgi:hypothetical protein